MLVQIDWATTPDPNTLHTLNQVVATRLTQMCTPSMSLTCVVLTSQSTVELHTPHQNLDAIVHISFATGERIAPTLTFGTVSTRLHEAITNVLHDRLHALSCAFMYNLDSSGRVHHLRP